MRLRWFYLLPILFFALFYFYPLGAIFRLSFAPDGHLELAALQKLVRDSYYLKTLWFTTWQALVSTALTLLFAFPGAYLFATYQFRGKALLQALSTLPFVLPTIVVANAFTALLGSKGVINLGLMQMFGWDSRPINLDNTLTLIFIAHIFYNYSVAQRIISTYWRTLNPRLAQAAQLLGASPRRAFWTITLPLLRPAIAAATVLVFIFTFTSFGVILILGGPRFATLEVEIYRQARNLFNLPVAAALSLFQILFTFGLMWFYTHTQAKMVTVGLVSAAPPRPIRTKTEKFLLYSTLSLMLILLGSPLIALVARSFMGQEHLTLRFYQHLFINERGSIFFVPPIMAIRNSILFALATMTLALTLGIISTYLIERSSSKLKHKGWKLLDPLFMLPLATSAVTLGFGYIIAFDEPPLNIRASIIIIPIAHTLIAMPFVIRALLPALRSIDPSLREASQTMGATPAQVWRTVDWPLIRRALLVAAVFAFTISMGEFGATLFVIRPDLPTMPIAIYRFLGQPGALNYGQSLAMSSLLMLVCATGFIAIERIGE